MNCTICGTHTSHGVLLCQPCKAALKRARQLTVQDVPRDEMRAAAKRARRGAPVPPLRRSETRGRSVTIDRAARMLLGAAAFAALAGVVYIVERELAGRAAIARTLPPVVARTPDTAPAEVAVARDEAMAATPTRAATPEPTSASDRQQMLNAAPTRTASATPTSAARAPLADTREARRQEHSVAPPPAYPAVDSFGPLAEAPIPPPPLVAVALAPPPPDRWQMMSEALSRCANEGWWSGFICGQRVRLASCEGYWGRVAQCPNPPENPR